MNVSHETSALLDSYVEELLKWNRRINLIGRATEADIRDRHIIDSAQLLEQVDELPERWLDMGSGGGLPALVLAIMCHETPVRFVCIEVDRRKASFLAHVARILGLNVEVIQERIENTDAVRAQVLSARAVAPLVDLLAHMDRHGTPGGVGIFPKGVRYQDEIDRAREEWRFSLDATPSRTSTGSFILKIRDIERV